MPQAPRVVARPPARRSPSWAAFLWIGLVLTAVRAFTGGFQGANPPPDPALRSPLSRPDRPLYIDPLPPTPAYRPLPPGAERIFRKEAEPKPAPDRGPP
jgi:hypothetical protein